MLLPLHCYDEAGRINPPKWLYWMLLLLCSDWLALVFSLLTFGRTSDILAMLYPDSAILGGRLLATTPFVVVIVLLGNRERLWKRSWTSWRLLIIPLLYVGLVASIAAQINTISHDYWAFHWTPAIFLLMNSVLAISTLKSLHIKAMITDWRYPEENSNTQTALITADDCSKPDQNTARR